MIRAITRLKPDEEFESLLDGLTRIFVVTCGTCPVLTRTGGEVQIHEMQDYLTGGGRVVTGTITAPVACDNLTAESLKDPMIAQSDAVVVMSCGYGVQNVARLIKKMVIPALDTLYIGKEDGPGVWNEVCTQCGTCIIGETGGICPVTSCHKGLVNGPCGGTDNGKCEIDKNIDCVWTNIYMRLKDLGRLDQMRKYQKLRHHNVSPNPGKLLL